MGFRRARIGSRSGELTAVALTACVLAGVTVGMAGVLDSGLDAAVASAAEARLTVLGTSPEQLAEAAAEAFGSAPIVAGETLDGAFVAPDPVRADADDLPVFAAGAEVFADEVARRSIAPATAVSGSLGDWARELEALAWQSRLLALVPFLLVVAAGFVAMRDVVRVLASSRVSDLTLARARGATRMRVLRDELIEVGGVGGVGAVPGGTAAAMLTGAPWWQAAALVAIVVLGFAAVTVPVVRSAVPADRAAEAAARSGRSRAVGVVGIVVAGAATVLAVWRLTTAGSAVDPLAAAAPALAIVASAGVVLAVVAVVAAVFDAAATRWRGLGAALAVRRLARQFAVLTTLILLVAIASSSIVFAATFAQTGERLARDARETRVGGDLLIHGPIPSQLADASGTSARLSAAGVFGGDEPLILAMSADRMPDALRAISQLVDPQELAGAVAVPAAGVKLPAGTTRVRFDVAATEGVTARAWFREPAGGVTSARIDGPLDVEATHLIAIDADLTDAAAVIRFRVLGLVATTPEGDVPVELPSDWQPQFGAFSEFSDDRIALAADAFGFDTVRRARDETHVRLMPSGTAGESVPAVISSAFAERHALEVGEKIEVRFAGTGRELVARVAAIRPVVPTAGDADAVLVDLPGFSVQQLRDEEVALPADSAVVRTSAPAQISAALPAGASATGLEPGTSDRMLGIARGLLWIAALGTAAVALIGVAGASVMLGSDRRAQTRILAVLGETPARQARGQAGELGLAAAVALVGGAGAGWVLGVIAAPAFARAATPGSGALPAVPVAVDVTGAALAIAALVLLLGLIIVGHAVRVTRHAHGSSEAM